jgi:RNA polymerase sigma factor (sigma-70 family)
MSATAGAEGLAGAMPDSPGQLAADGLGDVGELYLALAARLEKLVRLYVRAPDQVIEDACQFAWSRLVHRGAAVRRDSAFQWLVRTAVREAVKLVRRERLEVSLEAMVDNASYQPLRPGTPAIQDLLEQRERLSAVGALPERQQRLVWLHALGLTYSEMAHHEGYTRRTVERQLLRAKHRMRELEAG